MWSTAVSAGVRNLPYGHLCLSPPSPYVKQNNDRLLTSGSLGSPQFTSRVCGPPALTDYLERNCEDRGKLV